MRLALSALAAGWCALGASGTIAQAPPGCRATPAGCAGATRPTGKLLVDEPRANADARMPPPAPVAPIPSNFPAAPLIEPGFQRTDGSRIPRPDSAVGPGAFRILCTASHEGFDDPIVYPGQPGKSHLHEFYGNTSIDAASTYASIRRTGGSSCENALNRSGYWAPALLTAAGQVIRPDYITVYYKRDPAGDAACRERASGGCVELPTGLRILSGYDMARMGERQPENVAAFFFRCISPGKRSDHHPTLPEAVADCGGEGQIVAAVTFGECWNGALDSPDHRAHVAHARYRGFAYAQCDADHPWILPQISQQLTYTVRRQDGAIRFSCDMAGMAPGSCFHADYMEGWDPAVRARFHRLCIERRLSCLDGELGDGTRLKSGPRSLLATPRLVAAPRPLSTATEQAHASHR